MSEIALFLSDIPPEGATEGLASPGYVERRLGEELGKLAISARAPLRAVEKGGGTVEIILDGASAGGALWAWQVVTVDGGISITPGQVFLQNGFGGIEPFVPTLNGTPLDASTAPVLEVPPTGTYYLMLKVEIDKNGNPLNLPWSIVGGFVETESTLLVRPYNDNPGQDAEIYFTLTKLVDGEVTLQNWLARPISIAWTYNNVMAA